MTDRSPQEIIAAARLPERSHRVCLRGDLQARWEQLERDLAEAARVGASSLDGDGRTGIAREMEDLRADMDAATLELTFRALRRDRYQSLKAQHPPRKPADAKRRARAKTDDDTETLAELDTADRLAALDKQVGVNTDTFYPALAHACLVTPELADDEWDQMVAVLTSRQWDELVMVALAANEGEISVPFSPTASRLTRSSDAT